MLSQERHTADCKIRSKNTSPEYTSKQERSALYLSLPLSLSRVFALSLSLTDSVSCQPRRGTQRFRHARLSKIKCENQNH